MLLRGNVNKTSHNSNIDTIHRSSPKESIVRDFCPLVSCSRLNAVANVSVVSLDSSQ
eukprot:c32289_g1_i1 orf=2-169(-)